MMMSFDPERHHRRSIRLPPWDYAGNGVYFITICAVNREMLFGHVRDRAMIMNEFGWLVWEEWEKSAEIRPSVALDDFVVMPNHLHGVVTIVPEEIRTDGGNGTGVQTRSHSVLRPNPRSLGTFVAGFKGATTARINTMRGTPGAPVWQRNYYEKIVRDERMMDRILTYIEYNPLQWSLDRENPDRDRADEFERWLFSDPLSSTRRP